MLRLIAIININSNQIQPARCDVVTSPRHARADADTQRERGGGGCPGGRARQGFDIYRHEGLSRPNGPRSGEGSGPSEGLSFGGQVV